MYRAGKTGIMGHMAMWLQTCSNALKGYVQNMGCGLGVISFSLDFTQEFLRLGRMSTRALRVGSAVLCMAVSSAWPSQTSGSGRCVSQWLAVCDERLFAWACRRRMPASQSTCTQTRAASMWALAQHPPHLPQVGFFVAK